MHDASIQLGALAGSLWALLRFRMSSTTHHAHAIISFLCTGTCCFCAAEELASEDNAHLLSALASVSIPIPCMLNENSVERANPQWPSKTRGNLLIHSWTSCYNEAACPVRGTAKMCMSRCLYPFGSWYCWQPVTKSSLKNAMFCSCQGCIAFATRAKPSVVTTTVPAFVGDPSPYHTEVFCVSSVPQACLLHADIQVFRKDTQDLVFPERIRQTRCTTSVFCLIGVFQFDQRICSCATFIQCTLRGDWDKSLVEESNFSAIWN